VQLAVRQLVVDPGYVQAVRRVPSQDPPHVVPSPVHALRDPVGLPATAVHVPIDPVTLHASHWPPHAVSQQTPSTQFADVHCDALVHAVPPPFFGSHEPALQKSPVTQSASLEQVLKHTVDPQTYGEQDEVLGVGHAPAPSQLAEAVAVPAVQDAERQLVDELG